MAVSKGAAALFVAFYATLLFLAPWMQFFLSHWLLIAPPYTYMTDFSIESLICRLPGILISLAAILLVLLLNLVVLRLVCSTEGLKLRLRGSSMLVVVLCSSAVPMVMLLGDFLWQYLSHWHSISSACMRLSEYYFDLLYFGVFFYIVSFVFSFARLDFHGGK